MYINISKIEKGVPIFTCVGPNSSNCWNQLKNGVN